MYEYDEDCLKVFLKNQSQLFDEPVAETLEEAEAFRGLYGSNRRLFAGSKRVF